MMTTTSAKSTECAPLPRTCHGVMSRFEQEGSASKARQQQRKRMTPLQPLGSRHQDQNRLPPCARNGHAAIEASVTGSEIAIGTGSGSGTEIALIDRAIGNGTRIESVVIAIEAVTGIVRGIVGNAAIDHQKDALLGPLRTMLAGR